MIFDPLRPLHTEQEFREAFRDALKGRKFDDVHTHLASLGMNELSLLGLPEAGAYHYLNGEGDAKARRTRAGQQEQAKLSAMERATENLDRILGSGAPPVSTAANGWFGIAKALGLDSNAPHRDILREWDSRYGRMPKDEYFDMVFERSPVRSVVGTQSIFLPGETKYYVDDRVLVTWDQRVKMAIRFDEALRRPDLLEQSAAIAGFPAAAAAFENSSSRQALRDMITFFADRFSKCSEVKYLSASMGPKDLFFNPDGSPAQSRFAVIMREVMLPLARALNLPVFLMPYVTRGLNPDAGSSGDCVATGNFDDLAEFIAANPDVAFIVTTLHPSLNNNGCFLTRACTNVRLIGFWWGNLNSNEVRRQLQERFEFIGTAWFGLNSDARILDQLLYKWDDFFFDLEEVLAKIILPKTARRTSVTGKSIGALIDEIQDTEQLLWTPCAA